MIAAQVEYHYDKVAEQGHVLGFDFEKQRKQRLRAHHRSDVSVAYYLIQDEAVRDTLNVRMPQRRPRGYNGWVLQRCPELDMPDRQ